MTDDEVVCVRAIEAGLVDDEVRVYIYSSQDSPEEQGAFRGVAEKLAGLRGGVYRPFDRPYIYGGPRGVEREAIWNAFFDRSRRLRGGDV
jgi:hypothetical protein